MRTRQLGKTDLNLTTVGLGCWAIGGPWEFGWGPQDDEDSIQTIHEAIDSGVNWLDTAPIYGCGHSEVVVGRALKGMREKPLVATKCGLRWNDKHEKRNCLDGESILRECDESLERLGIETIDLYQIHHPDPDEKIAEAWEAMVRCKEQGKVQHIGVSNFSAAQLERVQKIHPVASLQPPYSMLRPEIEKDLLGFCRKNSIGIVCYGPIQMGLLTGKFSREHKDNLDAGDVRRKHYLFHEPRFGHNLWFVEQLKPIAKRNGISLAQLAIAWVLRDEAVTSAIAGARRPGQISETAAAGDITLGQEDLDEIDKLLKELDEKNG